jgi:hypothetical protein
MAEGTEVRAWATLPKLGTAMLHRPNAHATISGTSFTNASHCGIPGTSFATLSRVLTAYAALLVPAGRFAARTGRRWSFLVGSRCSRSLRRCAQRRRRLGS